MSADLIAEIARLKEQLDEAKETLRAITSGEVDALVVNTRSGKQVFTLQGADTVYRIAIENANEGVITVSIDGTILYANRYFARMLQVDLNKIIGGSLLDLVDPESRSRIKTLLRKNKGRIEVLIHSNGGVRVPVYIATKKFRLENSVTICALITDLTEQKAAEMELTSYRQHLEEMVEERTSLLQSANEELIKEASERQKAEKEVELRTAEVAKERARLFEVLETLPAMISLKTPDHRVVFSNRAYRQRYGESRGRHCYEISHGFTAPCQFCQSFESLKTGKPHQWEYTSPDGNTILEVHNFPLSDVDGSPLILEMDLDITERRKAMKAREESQRRFQALVESMSDFIWETDSSWRYTYCSPQAEILWGFRPETLVGTTPFDHMPPEIKEATAKILPELIKSPAPFRFENISYNSKSEPVTLEVSGAPYFDDTGKLLGYRGISRDITERKRVEETLKQYTLDLESANRELESFSYSASHDLRAPLRSLEGFSELLLQDYGDKLDSVGQDYLNRIRNASQNMAQLIDDLARLARVTRAEMSRREVNLSEIVASILGEFEAAQQERRAEFVIAPEIKTDADMPLVKILLRNLLDNAWKFTGKCLLTRVEFGVRHQDGTTVYFIKDNGAGFDMKFAERLFVPFQRLHASKEYTGTGIGLAIVQRVVQRHGGRIWAESEVGKGATFYFTLQ